MEEDFDELCVNLEVVIMPVLVRNCTRCGERTLTPLEENRVARIGLCHGCNIETAFRLAFLLGVAATMMAFAIVYAAACFMEWQR